MALRPVTRTHTLTGARTTLGEIVGFPWNTWVGWVAIRAARTNTGDLYWTDTDGERGGYLGPSEAATVDYGEGKGLINQFKLIGTAGDVAYVTVGIDSVHFKDY